MGIQLGSNFTVNTSLPLDDRTVVETITQRNNILAGKRYEGLIVYVSDEQKNYQLQGGIDNINWTESFGGGSGGSSSTDTGKELLVNNLVNNISGIGEYLAACPGIIVEYYLIRRTDTSVRRMSGVLRLETSPEETLTEDRWQLVELIRSEIGDDSGVTFSLTEIDTEKSILVATLDDMTGGNHSCRFYYKITKFNNDTGKIIILDNNSINPISAIGETLDSAGGIIVDYFIYRRTDAGFKTLSGKIVMEGNPDGATNPDKWELFEPERSSSPVDSGVTFSLDDVDVEKSILVVTLDNMAGSDHRCDFYYKATVLAN
jgi:hypothetical protein